MHVAFHLGMALQAALLKIHSPHFIYTCNIFTIYPPTYFDFVLSIYSSYTLLTTNEKDKTDIKISSRLNRALDRRP